MAKKKSSRKPNLSQEALERAKRELSESGFAISRVDPIKKEELTALKPKSQPSSSPVVRSKKTMMSKEELAAEYGYVIADLRNMGALAGLLFIAMVVVSLLIDQLV